MTEPDRGSRAQPPDAHDGGRPRPRREVVQLCSELIRIDSVNTGDPDTIGDGEARAARYIQHKLDEVGYETTYLEAVPGRGNVFCRLAGADPSRGALLVHGHVDVVPADASEWTVDPFSGAVQDGYVWGRGAVDMKDMVAMIVAVAREFKTHRVRPAARPDLRVHVRRGGRRQLRRRSGWSTIIRNCSPTPPRRSPRSAGSPSRSADDRRAYLVAAAEKGVAWATSDGNRPGRARFDDQRRQRRQPDRARRRHARRRTSSRSPTPRPSTRCWPPITELTGLEFPEQDLESCGRQDRPGGPDRQRHPAEHREPDHAQGRLQGERHPVDRRGDRRLPGAARLGGAPSGRRSPRIVGDGVEISWVWQPPLEFPFEGDLVEAMKAALLAEDPDGTAVPYMLSGGTDNKAFARLGIAGYGFSPLRLPRRSGLHRAVPRRRRAGAGGRADVRHPGAGPVAADLLTGDSSTERSAGKSGPTVAFTLQNVHSTAERRRR